MIYTFQIILVQRFSSNVLRPKKSVKIIAGHAIQFSSYNNLFTRDGKKRASNFNFEEKIWQLQDKDRKNVGPETSLVENHWFNT